MVKIVARRAVEPAVDYFLRDAALTDEERNSGRWLGRLADMLQLHRGPIAADELDRALRARVPSGPAEGWPMVGNMRPTPRVGWELVFSAPKSVSLAAKGEGGQRIQDAFVRAVQGTFRAVERLAKRQHQVEPTGSLLGALFLHHQSRRNDPHLHAHVLVAHSTWDEGRQRFYRLEPREIYRQIRHITGLFHRILQRQLAKLQLPARLTQVGRLLAVTLTNIPHAVARAFSSGRRLLEELSAAQPPPPGMTHNAWRNVLNDRTRPEKSAAPPRSVWVSSAPLGPSVPAWRSDFRRRVRRSVQIGATRVVGGAAKRRAFQS